MTGADSLDYESLIPPEMLNELSPEERKQLQEAMELGKQMHDQGITGNMTTGDALAIPQRQDKLLSEIPTLSSKQQYVDYLANLITNCKKNFESAIITDVDDFISKNSNDKNAIGNFAAVLLMQKKPNASIYAAIKTAMLNPDDVVSQDNLAVILHQTGYPHISLPILLFLLQQNNYSIIQNNIAQDYLSLGDKENAKKYFIGCLQIDPNHCDANCGMGLILSEEGNISEATPYIIKSLKNGYTTTADEVVKKHKINIKFSDIKQKVPEYFNPQKYRPIPPAYDVEMVEPTLAQREALYEKVRTWNQKKEEVNNEQNNKIESESMMEIMDRNRGYLSNSPLTKKSQLMINLIGVEYYEFIAKDYKSKYFPAQKEFYSELEKLSYEKGYDIDGCKKQIEILKNYLQKSAKNHEAYSRETLPNIYDWVNQSLHWWYFLSNEEQYKVHYVNYVSEFFEAMHGYDEMQSLSTLPAYISKNCKDLKEPVKVKIADDSLPEVECPIKIEIPLGAAKVKWDCKGYEIEGGELIMLGFEKDFKSGEMTIFFGLGVGFYGKGTLIGGVEGGIKGGSFFKIGKDFSILDAGNKGEIGLEGGIGPFMTEGKLTGVMGLESGINVDGTIFGHKIEDPFGINTKN